MTATLQGKGTKGPWSQALEFAGPLLAGLVGAIGFLFTRMAKRSTELFSEKQNDNPRDVFAYALGAHKFYSEADEIRRLRGDFTYWSGSDQLAESCIRSGDSDQLAHGVSCLSFLLEYAPIDPIYAKIIHFNIARMSAVKSDAATAKKHLAIARNPRHEVIEKRIACDENLSRIVQP